MTCILEQIPNGETITEEHLDTAFGGGQFRNATTEAFFYEQVYRYYEDWTRPIPIDEAGEAQIYERAKNSENKSCQT